MAALAATAVVVNYRSGGVLQDCLDSLRAGSAPLQIVVVDNDGADERIARVAARADAELLINPRNVGYPAACNQGAARASTEFLLFINPDCRVQTDTVAELLAALQQDDKAALAGGRVTNPDGSEQRGTRRRLPTPRRIVMTMTAVERFAGRLPMLDGVNERSTAPEATMAVEAVSGALMLVRCSAFESVGGFDPGYFLHVEDLDLFARLQAAGWRILYVPSALATHVKGVSQRASPVLAERYKHASLLRYLRKFHGPAMRGPVGWTISGLAWSHFGLTAPLRWLQARWKRD